MNILSESNLKIKNGIPYLEINELSKLRWVKHAFLTRRGGISPHPYDSLNLSKENGDRIENILINKKLIADTFNFNPERLILLKQIHKDKVLVIENVSDLKRPVLEYDAIITNLHNIFCGILTADCIPIFIVDQKKKIIASIHTGWQGTALKITKKVLVEVKHRFNSSPEDIIAVLGPSIGVCCYEVDEKILNNDLISFLRKENHRWFLDLSKANIVQLEEEGIHHDQIYLINLCTHCYSNLFFSYRRERVTGRQLSFIGIV